MSIKKAVGLAVKRIMQDAKGAASLMSWLGSGGEPVQRDQAKFRGNTCLKCPLNGALRRSFESKVALAIREQEQVRKGLDLSFPFDPSLKFCQACGCQLRLKIWVPLKHMQSENDSKTFPTHCWMRTEAGKVDGRIITIRRNGAFGDVIMATVIATRLWEMGFRVRFVTSDLCSGTIAGHPHIHEVVSGDNFTGPVDIDLDGAYEVDREDAADAMVGDGVVSVYLKTVYKQTGIQLNHKNQLPVLAFPSAGRFEAVRKMAVMPKPWILFVRRSVAWKERTINAKDFAAATKLLPGTVFVLPPDKQEGLNATVADWVRTFADVKSLVSVCDLVITPDTGPMHAAAAARVPLVVVQQSVNVTRRLSDQADYTVVQSKLSCSPCNQSKCPLDEPVPPCQRVDPAHIAREANKQLDSRSNGRVSVIVPTMQQTRAFKALECVFEDVPLEEDRIIALDGKGTGGPWHAGVKTVREPGQRTGFGKTCHRGVRASQGEFLLFLNDDCFLEPGAVKEMLSHMKDPEVAVVGCLLLYPNGLIQHGGMHRVLGGVGYGHIDHMKKPSQAIITEPQEMEAVTFAAALVRRSSYFSVGGFDQRFDCYEEDVDLCLQLRRLGRKVIYTPKAVGIHHESQTTAPNKANFAAASKTVLRDKWEPYFLHNPIGQLGTDWSETK